MNININIKILGIEPDTSIENQINQFEEIALFLDCEIVQSLIKRFRERIQLSDLIPYDKFETWKQKGIILDELTKEESIAIDELDEVIDYLEHKPSKDIYEEKELQEKKDERIEWLDPCTTFLNAIKKELKDLKKEDFVEILTKAIVCGEIQEDVIKKVKTTRKGARKIIFKQRERYWAYKNLSEGRHDKDQGYGYIGQQEYPKVPLQTVRSSVNSYKKKLLNYDFTLRENKL